MGADHDVDGAIGDALFHPRELRVRHQPRGLPDLDWKTVEALGESLGVLARQQPWSAPRPRPVGRSWRWRKAARSATSVLPKPTSPQNESVHGRPDAAPPPRCQSPSAVVGLLVGEAGAEFVVRAVFDRELGCLAQLPLGCDLDQLVRDLADCGAFMRALRACQAPPQGGRARGGLVRTVAREHSMFSTGSMKRASARIANELIKIAAERQLREAPKLAVEHGPYDEFCAGFPLRGDRRPADGD